jgi:hypothetical protein
MDSALYYTFSTIAQALAAAVALLAAFLLYRLQSINSEMEERTLRIIQYYGGKVRLRLDELHVTGDYEEIALLTKDPLPPNLEEGEVGFARKRLGVLVSIRNSLRRDFRLSLLLTVLLATFSVLILALTPMIAHRSLLTNAVFLVGITWFIACLYSYFRLARKALN